MLRNSSHTHSVCDILQRRWLGILLLLLFLGLFAAQGFAQEATIVGTVTDPTGAAVPNAKVTLTQTETATSKTFVTNNDGQYVANPLGIGHYTIKVDAQGFKRVEQTGITLLQNARDRYDFKLQVGSTTEQVTVEANAVGVQTDTSEVSDVITGKQVESLATNGRSIYSLINLTTGASSTQPDFQVATPVGGNANVSFNGQRMGHNIYLLDGGENLDRGGSGTFSVMPSLEAIAEFRTMTSNYTADYGLSSAATMSTVLKSGTKTLHASAWEYNRNDAFDARPYFNRAPAKKAKLNSNTFGFNVGGQLPIGKSQPTFFFYNMEWRKLRQGGSYNVKVPDPATYGGNFGSTAITVPTLAQVAPSVLFAGCGGVAPAGIVQGAPFPGNTIPTCMISPNATALLGAGIFPAPTSGTQFQGTPSTPTDVREEIVRIDHEFNSKNTIFAHFVAEQISQGFGTTIWSGDNVPTVGSSFGNPSYSGILTYTRIINDHLLNEATFNYSGNRINITPTGIYAAPSGFTFNRIYTATNELNRIPTINLSNTNTHYDSNWVPWSNQADAFQWLDAVTWTHGNHQMKIGGSYQRYRKFQDLFAPNQGNFTFDGSYTGNDFADMLLGLAQGYNENAIQPMDTWVANSYAAYFQDNWRATSRLTLNLGLRWDGAPHTYIADNAGSNFYPNLYQAGNAPTWLVPGTTIDPTSKGLGTSPNPDLAGYQFYVNGLGIAGQNGIPSGFVDNHWAQFGPRVGFAYDLMGDGKTVMRGGFGMMYERVQGNDMYNAGPNQPFSANVSQNNVSLQNPKTNVATGSTLVVPPLPILVGNLTGLTYNNYKAPYTMQYSFGFQRSVTAKTVFNISYVGSTTKHQNDYREYNLPAYSALPTLMTQGTAEFNQAVPYAGYHSIRMSQNEANGNYNSLQTSFNGNVTRDLTLNAGYTWSRAIDALNGGGSGNDLANMSNSYVGWAYDRGPSLFDRTHIFYTNFVYEIPLFRNSSSKALKTIAGGWEISGIVQAMSGAPINVTQGNSIKVCADGTLNCAAALQTVSVNSVCSIVPNCTNRPNVAGPISYVHNITSAGLQYFAASTFAAATPGTYGNLGNNALRGPGRHNWNMSLFKNFVISESRGSSFQFRADAFNVWNHTQWQGGVGTGGIGSTFGGSNFGVSTATYEPRVWQLGAKLIF